MIVVPGSMPNMMRSFANFNLLFCRMKPLRHKAKHYLISAAKVLILLASFYFIYRQLADNDALDWQQFTAKFSEWRWYELVFLVFLSFANRFLEILKWKNLVHFIRPMKTGEAAAQVLGALTAGTFTPNGIGEYGAKALYFEKSQAKTVVFLNLICNGIQMILSILFGLIGLLYFNWKMRLLPAGDILMIFGGIAFVFGLVFLGRNFQIRGLSVRRLLEKIGQIPHRIHRKNAVLALGRYAAFSHQYYFLFMLFGVDLPYGLLMATIAAVYFLASSLPTFQFLDFAVKGSVSLFFFGFLGINEWVVAFITTLMWLLNVVIPVGIGSYFVLKFKSPWLS